MTPLPPDRGAVATEQVNAASHDLDTLAPEDLVRMMLADQRTAIEAVESVADQLAELGVLIADGLAEGGRLIYIGAGTSGRLGVLDASECPPTFNSRPEQVIGLIAGGDSALRVSSEHREDDSSGAAEALDALQLGTNDTVIAIAAGGTTPYACGALAFARERGASTALLTCSPTPPPPGCQRVVLLNTGPEILTGSTRLKAGTVTKIALNVLSTLAFVRLGKVYGNLMVDMRATNDKLRDRAARILCSLTPGLDRGRAFEILTEANGELKTAIVIARLGVNANAARQRLADAKGNLRPVIDGV